MKNVQRAWNGRLISSSILNLVLAGWIVGTHRHGIPSNVERLEVKPGSDMAERGQDTQGLTIPGNNASERLWSQIESTNYVLYVRNLRAVGCPETTIIDIITADVGQLFEESRAVARATGRRRGDPQRVVSAEVAALDRREGEVLSELLGEGWRKWRRDKEGERWSGMEWMSLDMVDQVQGIEERAELEAEAIQSKARLALTSMDRAALKAIEQRKEQALLEVLGAEGLAEYRFESSGAPESLAMLPGITFSDRAEMRRVFEIESEAERQLEGDLEEGTSEERHRQVEAKKVEALMTLLGEQRYAQFERARDFRFQQLHEISERFGLNEGVAQAIYEMHRNQQLKRQGEAGWASEFPDTARSTMLSLLGDPAFAVYSEVIKEW